MSTKEKLKKKKKNHFKISKLNRKKIRIKFSSPLKNYRKTILHDSNFIHPYPAPFNSINSNFQSPKTFKPHRFHPRFKPQTSQSFFFFFFFLPLFPPPANKSTTRESQWPGRAAHHRPLTTNNRATNGGDKQNRFSASRTTIHRNCPRMFRMNFPSRFTSRPDFRL